MGTGLDRPWSAMLKKDVYLEPPRLRVMPAVTTEVARLVAAGANRDIEITKVAIHLRRHLPFFLQRPADTSAQILVQRSFELAGDQLAEDGSRPQQARLRGLAVLAIDWMQKAGQLPYSILFLRHHYPATMDSN